MAITGATVILYEKVQTGVDEFNHPIYTETPITVDNVLIGEPSSDDIADSVNLYGKKIVYMLGIPKGDSHNWEDSAVEFFGGRYKTFGYTIQGIESNIPLSWHRKIRVERYG